MKHQDFYLPYSQNKSGAIFDFLKPIFEALNKNKKILLAFDCDGTLWDESERQFGLDVAPHAFESIFALSKNKNIEPIIITGRPVGVLLYILHKYKKINLPKPLFNALIGKDNPDFNQTEFDRKAKEGYEPIIALPVKEIIDIIKKYNKKNPATSFMLPFSIYGNHGAENIVIDSQTPREQMVMYHEIKCSQKIIDAFFNLKMAAKKFFEAELLPEMQRMVKHHIGEANYNQEIDDALSNSFEDKGDRSFILHWEAVYYILHRQDIAADSLAKITQQIKTQVNNFFEQELQQPEYTLLNKCFEAHDGGKHVEFKHKRAVKNISFNGHIENKPYDYAVYFGDSLKPDGTGSDDSVFIALHDSSIPHQHNVRVLRQGHNVEIGPNQSNSPTITTQSPKVLGDVLRILAEYCAVLRRNSDVVSQLSVPGFAKMRERTPQEADGLSAHAEIKQRKRSFTI